MQRKGRREDGALGRWPSHRPRKPAAPEAGRRVEWLSLEPLLGHSSVDTSVFDFQPRSREHTFLLLSAPTLASSGGSGGRIRSPSPKDLNRGKDSKRTCEGSPGRWLQ